MSTENAPEMPPRRLLWTLLVAAVLLAVDQLTKGWAVDALTDRAPIPVIGDFIRFRLLYNPGAAFSLGADSTWIFAIVAAVAVVVLLWISRKVRSAGWAISLGLLLGGATTHLGDRLFRDPGFARGHVVDFIDYNGWFVGNVADIALFFGAVSLFVLSFRGVPIEGVKQVEETSAE